MVLRIDKTWTKTDMEKRWTVKWSNKFDFHRCHMDQISGRVTSYEIYEIMVIDHTCALRWVQTNCRFLGHNL